MSETKTKTIKFKKLIGLLIPLLVLAVTVTMASVSYAWFYKDTVAAIEEISLTTSSVYTLGFSTIGASGDAKYIGQTAYKDALLVTERRATSSVSDGGLGLDVDSTEYKNYIIDAAYTKKMLLKLDTDGKAIDFNISFADFKIWSHTYGDNDEILTTELAYGMGWGKNGVDCAIAKREDIEYCATWYLKKTGGTVYYTPYGEMTEAQFNNPSAAWATMPQKQGINNFSASSVSDIYEIYLVFAPEKLFWAQYSAADWQRKVRGEGGIYTDDEMLKICDSFNNNTSINKPFYSTSKYQGDDFEFTMEMKVLNILNKEALL